MGQHPRILRKRTDRLHAMGAGWWHQRNDQLRLGKSHERSRRHHLSAGAGMVATSITANAADSRHVIPRAPGTKYGGTENTVAPRRMEDDRCVSEQNMIGPGALTGCLRKLAVSSRSRESVRGCCQRDIGVSRTPKAFARGCVRD